jgi:hypothetical protein
MRDPAEQFKQSTISRSVDAGRPGDSVLNTSPAGGVASRLFAFKLTSLIDIAGPERSVLVCWWMLDIAVNADRAALYDSRHARFGAHLNKRTNRVDVDSPILRLGDADLSIHCRNVVDDVDAIDRSAQRAAIFEVADRHLDASLAQSGCPGRVANQRPHLATASGERPRQIAARETGRSGYEDSQRSATIVTGDPTSCRIPTAASPPSTATVNLRDPISL